AAVADHYRQGGPRRAGPAPMRKRHAESRLAADDVPARHLLESVDRERRTEVIAAAAFVEIVRDTPEDVQDRWVRVSVDGGPEQILRYGQTLRLTLPPGRHR